MDDKTFNDLKDAQTWISAVESANSRIRETDIYPRLRQWVNEISPVDVLEIGCGQGICSDKIDLDGRTYTGVEPSTFLLDRAIELYHRADRHFISGSAYGLPFSNGTFDAAFSVAVWHLLSDPQSAASELSRVLKSNGDFLIITANPVAYSLWTDRFSESKVEGRRFEGTMRLQNNSVSHDILYLHTLDEILNSLRAVDLKIQKTETFRTSEASKEQDFYISIQGQKAP